MLAKAALNEEQWTKTVRRGARWVFGAAVISPAFVNGFAFALPLFGGTRRGLLWVAPLPALAGLGIVYAVFLVTVREPGGVASRSDMKAMLRIVAVSSTIAHFLAPISLALVDPANTNYFYLARNLLWLGLVCVFFVYVRSLAKRFELHKLSRTAGTLAWLFPASSLAVPLGHEVFAAAVASNNLTFLLFGLGLDLCVGVWALHCVWRFGSSITSAARGRCLRCGYQLSGLTENRCPECSTPFSKDWPLEPT